MYRNMAELEEATLRCGGLAAAVLQDEKELTQCGEDEIYAELAARWQVMRAATQKALHQPQRMPGSLIAGQAAKQQAYAQAGPGFAGAVVNRAMALALSASEVNATMGKVCAAPTAGACGVLPAVLGAVAEGENGEEEAFSQRQLLDALLVAGGIGAVITRNATVSGAEGGCQAECGAAAAMAAAAVVQLAGGSAKTACNAAALALMNCMGLVCDPVAGLVQLPCSYRNASQAANALLSADLALAGQSPVLSPDEVVEAMLRVGRSLPPTLRETALGGIAASATARRVAKGQGRLGVE